MESVDLRISLALLQINAADISVFIVLDRQLSQMSNPFLILSSKSVNLGLVVADSLEQLTVCLFSREEFLDNFLYVCAAGILSNSLECLLILLLAIHLLLHLLLEVGTPESLN